MEESEPVIIIEKPNENDDSIIQKEPASILDIIKTIIVFYFIIGILCYFFSPKWFNSLYKNPYEYILSLTKKE